jgi:hypothetical protein
MSLRNIKDNLWITTARAVNLFGATLPASSGGQGSPRQISPADWRTKQFACGVSEKILPSLPRIAFEFEWLKIMLY